MYSFIFYTENAECGCHKQITRERAQTRLQNSDEMTIMVSW